MRFRGAECSHIVTQLSPELLHRAKLQLGRLWAAPPTPSPAPDPPPGCLYASGSSGVTQRLAFCDFGRHPVLEVRPCRGRRQNVPFRGSVMPRCLPGPRPTSPPIRRRAPGVPTCCRVRALPPWTHCARAPLRLAPVLLGLCPARSSCLRDERPQRGRGCPGRQRGTVGEAWRGAHARMGGPYPHRRHSDAKGARRDPAFRQECRTKCARGLTHHSKSA